MNWPNVHINPKVKFLEDSLGLLQAIHQSKAINTRACGTKRTFETDNTEHFLSIEVWLGGSGWRDGSRVAVLYEDPCSIANTHIAGYNSTPILGDWTLARMYIE